VAQQTPIANISRGNRLRLQNMVSKCFTTNKSSSMTLELTS